MLEKPSGKVSTSAGPLFVVPRGASRYGSVAFMQPVSTPHRAAATRMPQMAPLRRAKLATSPYPPLPSVRSIESAPSCPGVALVSRRHPCMGGAAVYSARPVTGLPCVAAVGLQPPVQPGDALVLRGDEPLGVPAGPRLVDGDDDPRQDPPHAAVAEQHVDDGQDGADRQPRRPHHLLDRPACPLRLG